MSGKGLPKHPGDATHARRVNASAPANDPMVNPYEPSDFPIAVVATNRRAVRRYWIISAALFIVGITVALPGLQLLNQELGWISTQTGIFGIEFNGKPISNATAIRYSIGLGLALWAVALISAAKATMNRRHNRLNAIARADQ